MATVTIIDDNLDICRLLDSFLKRQGHHPVFFTNGEKALEFLRKNAQDIIFCDFRLPDTDGKELLKQIKEINPGTQVIIITGYSDVKIAVDVIKMGAFDYITKPLLPEEILLLIEKALNNKKTTSQSAFTQPHKENGFFTNEDNGPISKKTSPGVQKGYVVGKSSESLKLQKQIELVAPTNYSVIIYGESGTGKEAVAYGIHAHSPRKNKPFIAVDCGALTKELAGSELFGHEKGAFTGAVQSKIGQFELANEGTIFLDEAANLSYDTQASLLRVVQERKIRRIGSAKEINVDVRILVASNEKLCDFTGKGRFREDLYHRFNEFSINLPPLRDRDEDIMVFANFFLENACSDLGKNILGFAPDVEKLFLNYNWPGNLREMNNLIKRAALLTSKNTITLETLPQEIIFQSKFNPFDDRIDEKNSGKGIAELKAVVINAEYEKILEVLRKVNFNKSKAAQLLNIDRKTLYNKMKTFDLLVNANT